MDEVANEQKPCNDKEIFCNDTSSVSLTADSFPSEGKPFADAKHGAQNERGSEKKNFSFFILHSSFMRSTPQSPDGDSSISQGEPRVRELKN